MENKSLWQIIKGTLLGTDNEGSAKRATGFWLTIVLVTSLIAVEEYCYILSAKALVPTINQQTIVSSHESIIWTIIFAGLIYGGQTSVDKLIDLFKFIRGGNKEQKTADTVK